MDNPERSGELMTNVQLVSHLDEELKIVHDGVKGGRDEVSLISSDDVGTQYMTIHSEQTISKEPQEHLGDCDSQSDTLTASSLSGNGGQGEEMLAHVVQMPSGQHALVVDIMEAVPTDGSKNQPHNSSRLKEGAYYTTVPTSVMEAVPTDGSKNQPHSSSQLKEGAYYTTVPTSGTSVGNRVTLLSPVSTGNSDHHHIQHHSVHHSTESLPVVSRAYIPDTDGMVVATSGHYSETATGVVEEDILPHDLTEEDRRLAAALVAVQLVQQQKHQLHQQQQQQQIQQHLPVCVSDATNVIMNTAEIQGLIGVGKGLHPEDTHVVVTTDKPVSSAMVVDYIQAVEDGSVVSSNHDKADELVVSSPRIRTRDVDGPYGQPHQDDNSYAKLHVILPHPKKAMMGQGAAVRNRLKRFRTEIEESSVVHMLDTNAPVVDGVQYVTVSNLGTTLKNEHGEVMEMIEVGEEADELGEGIEEEEILEELEDEDEMEEVCAREELEALDYETGTSEGILGPSDRSLPHKKRIPPKLKGNTLVIDGEEKKKLSQVHVKCYKCEICGEGLASQGDYEAHKEQMHPQEQSIDGVKKNPFTCLLCGQAFPSQFKFFEHLKCHYEPLLENEQSRRKVKEEDTEVKHEDEPLHQVETVEMTLVDESQHPVTRAPEEMAQKEIHIIHHQEQPPGVELPAFLCTHCNKTFRRQKAYETHMNLVHGPDDEEEEDEHQQQQHHTITTHGTVLEETVVVTSKKDQQQTEWIPTFFAEEDDDDDDDDEDDWGDGDVLDRAARRRQQNSGSGTGDGANEASTDGQGMGIHHHVCEVCGGAFQSRAQLNHHVQEEHPESAHSGNQRKKARKGGGASSGGGGGGSARKIEHMTCSTCGRVFNHRNSLVYHMRSHTGERPHQCEVCGKSFFAASALKVHMRLHSGDKPYKCEYCGRHFRQWGDLKYHCISIHSDEKQYQCEYCGKDFARKYSLIVHRRIHTGEKNYKCDFCEKSFRASSYLQNHRRIHTGEKPHPCEVCGKPFRVRSDMKRHMQTHNRETNVATVTTIATDPLASNGSQTLASDGDPSPPPDSQDHQVHHSSLTGSPHHHTMDPSGTLLGTELVVTTDTSKTEQITEEEAESILPDDGLGNHQAVTTAVTTAQHTVSQHVSTQPIDLNLVPGRAGVSIQQGHLSAAVTEQVVQEVLHYARDPLEQRDNANTLYVWPIYMS